MLSAKAFARASAVTAREEAAFFAALRLPNGTFKTTADHRMDDLNEFVAARWAAHDFRPVTLLDVGASSGIASLEWLRCLTAHGFDVRLTATDLVFFGELVGLYPGFEVLAAQGAVLQHIICGVGVRPWRRRLDYVTGYAVLGAIANRIAAGALRRKTGRAVASLKIPMISKRVRDEPAIAWVEDDVFAPRRDESAGPFDAVRVANVLNRGYFAEDEIRRAIVNLKAKMTGPGAWLILNRTHSDGANHATLFALARDARFEVRARFGQGSEIEELVLSA